MTREEAKEFIVQSVKEDVDIAKVADAIKALQPVTPTRKVGKWIITDKEHGRIWHCHCSNCKKDPQDCVGGTENWWLVRLPDYCPNCGANMEVKAIGDEVVAWRELPQPYKAESDKESDKE